MLLSVVAWDDGVRSTCETKIRTELSMAGQRTADAPGKLFAIPTSAYARAAEAVRWTLSGHDGDETEGRFLFTTLVPAYALADAAETCDPDKPGSGDSRLIVLQSLWDQLKPIDIAVVVRSKHYGDVKPTGDTLVDAARDLSRKTIVVDPEDVWGIRFGERVAAELIKLAGKRGGGADGHAGRKRKNVRGNAGRSR